MDAANRLRLSFAEALGRRVAADPALDAFVDALSGVECLEHRGPVAPVPDHAGGHLARGLEGLACETPLAAAVASFAADAEWYCLLEGAEIDPVLVEGMLVGRPKLPQGAGLRFGLFLIAPGVYYPLHQHAAHEVYFVASGGLEIQHGTSGTPFALGPGEHSVTPVNRVHALRTGETPCLLLYVWAGKTESPSWWWAEDDAGWHRTRWDRAETGRWYRTAREPVTAAVLRQAGEIG